MKKVYSILCLFIATVAFVSCSDDDDTVTLSSLNNITDFKMSFEGLESDDIIYKTGNSITVSVPFGTTLDGLVATITVNKLAEIVPASGVEVDYVDGQATVFTVTAEDGTTKMYDVTISVRGEVGSGSQLATYTVSDDIFGSYSITYSYSDANFVTSMSLLEYGEEVKTMLVYDNKNQVIEKKVEADKLSTVYTYNDLGQIITALKSADGSLTDTYTYVYDSETEYLISATRVESNDKVSVVTYTIENGNVISEDKTVEIHTATYDDKNNPFKGIYPKAYAAINIGIHGVNENNPIDLNIDDNGVTYVYNDDDYPVSSTYTYMGFANVNKTFTYITE
ncbi:MAG: hypothetical protein COB98_06115 [Flavobacteriaceae bacterium]|nr:MAG: hypothetical protein COB98_06115 [Flavobacteriaceae bacterium]